MMLGILNDSDAEWLAANGEQRRITGGTVLIREGHPIDALYILLDGRLAVSAGPVSNQLITVLLSGEVVGEISFVDSRPPLASVTAIDNAHVLAVSRSKLLTKMEHDPDFAARFYKSLAAFLADRLRSVTGRLGYLSETQVDSDAIDELDDGTMDHVSLAATRFDNMLKRLRSN